MKLAQIFIISAMSFLVLSLGQTASGYGGPPAQSSSGDFTVEIYSDKEFYSLGESVTFSGSVSKYDEDRDYEFPSLIQKITLLELKRLL